jgi:hypothetical protein
MVQINRNFNPHFPPWGSGARSYKFGRMVSSRNLNREGVKDFVLAVNKVVGICKLKNPAASYGECARYCGSHRSKTDIQTGRRRYTPAGPIDIWNAGFPKLKYMVEHRQSAIKPQRVRKNIFAADAFFTPELHGCYLASSTSIVIRSSSL